MPSYRLDKKDWIPVLLRDGSQKKTSLAEVVERAGEIAQIVGDPLETACLLRLLFAVAHTVAQPKHRRDWPAIWKDRQTLLSKMSNYIEIHGDCFDLYSETKPFLQNVAIEDVSNPAQALVYDRARGNNPVFFDGAGSKDSGNINSDKAARALLVTHAFSGAGLGAINPLNENKKDQMFAGPLCGRLVGVVEGDRLDKTFALNLIADSRRWPAGVPNWERKSEPTPRSTPQEGLSDLFTRPTRNARLKPNADGTHCEAIQLYQGAAVALTEGEQSDPMIPMYLAADKKFKVLRLDPEKALWRQAEVVFATKTAGKAIPLVALAQLNEQIEMADFLDQERLSMRILGVAADAQGPVTTMWRDECLQFTFSAVADEKRHAELVEAVAEAEQAAENLRRRIYMFARSYLKQGDGDPDRKNVQRLADELNFAVTNFWSAVGPAGEQLALTGPPDNWKKRMEQTRRKCLEEAIEALPDSARKFRAQFSFVSKESV